MLLRHYIRSVLVSIGLGCDGMWRNGASHVSYAQYVNPLLGNGRLNCSQNSPAIHSSGLQWIFQFVSQFGVPDFIHTDQGRNFESALMCTLLGVSKTRISPYDPKSDGLIERFNRTLLSLLSMATRQDEQNWDLHLPLVMLAYRTNVQESTGCTPLNMYLEEKLGYL